MNVCTIAARNYLPYVRVLAQSFYEHHPGGHFTLLALEDLHVETITGRDQFRVWGLEDIGLDHGEINRFRTLYDVMELATAVKPWLIRRLLAERPGPVIYLDPDIEIFSSLEEVAELARAHSIVLTPHTVEPMPRDELRLVEADILAAGVYNLGFIATTEAASGLLDWWSQRLQRDCISDPASMLFVDQRWMDLAPVYFAPHILKDKGYNVAYWNLHERDLAWVDDHYEVGGRPLRFFHFSGYDPDVPYRLTKHMHDRPRIRLSERPAIRGICDQYRAKLRAQGWGSLPQKPYAYGTLANGITLDLRIRRLYRRELIESERTGSPEPPNPFDVGGLDRFVAWLNQPMDYGRHRQVSRYLHAVYDDWVTLQRTFPDLSGPDADAYKDWASRHGAEQARIPAQLLPQSPKPDGTREGPSPQPAPGINVAGYLRADNGLGEAARGLVKTAERAGMPLATFTYLATPSLQRHEFIERGPGGNPYDINIICVNADEIPQFVWDVGPGYFRDRYTVGHWAWETEDFPEAFRRSLELVDEVWTPSEFSSAAIRQLTEKPVVTFPHAVEVPSTSTGLGRADLGLPQNYVFLFSFDLRSIIERKNPFGLIEAFSRAFQPGEGPTLVLKTMHGDQCILELEQIRAAAAERPDIMVVDRYLTHEENAAFTASCDCYVSLHRAEGFGLTIAEAMALGKPAIATGYSGNLEYMTEENSYLVGYERVRVGRNPIYPEDSHWAEPDLDEAAALMRRVYDNPDEARMRGKKAKADMQRHTPAARVAPLKERVESIRVALSARREEAGVEAATSPSMPAIELAARYLAQSPSVEVPTRVGGPYRSVATQFRRLMLRLLANYHLYQHSVSTALVDAIREVDNRRSKDADQSGRATDHLKMQVRNLEEENALLRSRIDVVEANLGEAAEMLAQVDERIGEQGGSSTGKAKAN